MATLLTVAILLVCITIAAASASRHKGRQRIVAPRPVTYTQPLAPGSPLPPPQRHL